MPCQIAVIGGGLAGLVACRNLAAAGLDFILLEARDRLGGRILSCDQEGFPCDDGFDLGPSWYWPEVQPELAALVETLNLETFPQNGDGDILFERMSREAPQRCRPVEAPGGARRIAGGSAALIRALADALPAERLLTGVRAAAMRLSRETVDLTLHPAAGGETRLTALQVILAAPPRLLANSLAFQPPMDEAVLGRWRSTPTWMAPQAKFFAIYDAPFWRDGGFSGTAQSMVGPMVEIHDATTASGKAALFGFVGPGPDQRATWGEAALRRACLEQLARLFGAQALSPSATLLKDWATDPLTATTQDRTPSRPGAPDQTAWISSLWAGRLLMAGSETSPREPGYLAGAVQAAAAAATAAVARMDGQMKA